MFYLIPIRIKSKFKSRFKVYVESIFTLETGRLPPYGKSPLVDILALLSFSFYLLKTPTHKDAYFKVSMR